MKQLSKHKYIWDLFNPKSDKELKTLSPKNLLRYYKSQRILYLKYSNPLNKQYEFYSEKFERICFQWKEYLENIKTFLK